jgi:hypothetical protein
MADCCRIPSRAMPTVKTVSLELYAHERKCSMHRESDAQRSTLPPLHKEQITLWSVERN